MKTKLIASFSVLMAILVILSIAPSASMIIPVSDKAKDNSQAPGNSPVIDEDWDIVRVDLVHYARPQSPPKGPKSDSCYKLLNLKWKDLPVDYTINPANPDGLPEDFVTGAISTSAETWDDALSEELFNDIYTIDYTRQYGRLDSINAISFGTYPDQGVIAVTTYWYYPLFREIVEFDILFNTQYTWGDAEVSNVVDLQNIATHEFGHGIGMGDIYSDTCAQVTMYGYSGYGDIDKRTLEKPDITGLSKIYRK